MQYYELNTLKHNFKDNTFNNRPNLLALLKSITNPLYEPGEDELKTLWIKVENPSYETFRKDLLEEEPDAKEEEIQYEYEKYSDPWLGYPVQLNDSVLLKERLQGTETIGIVPKDILPRYCDTMFPSGSVHNFMNLWEEDLAALPYVTWQEVPVPELND